MNLRARTALVVVSLIQGATACVAWENRSIPTDAATIAKGEATFSQSCSGCHNFTQDGIGPQLAGLTSQVSASWIERFVRDRSKLLDAGDKRARELLGRYSVPMPSYASLTPDEMTALVAYINAKKTRDVQAPTTAQPVSDPIPNAITPSTLVVGLQFVTKIPASSDHGQLPLTRITKLDKEPGSGRTFVLDLRGKLYELHGSAPTVYMDMAKLKPKFIHEPGLATGFGSFAFHPDFARNGLLYTTHTESAGSGKADFAYADSIKVALQWVLTEWKVADPRASTFSGTGRELFRVNMVSGIHGVQEIAFNPTAKPGAEDYGMLYIGIGDGGAVENRYVFLAHSKEQVWGTILRIDPLGRNSRNGQYGIPAGNPWVRVPGALGEIFAYGFRNPHRLTWTASGQLLAPNIGHGTIESVNLVLPGHDYGWPIREGTFALESYGDLNKVYPLPANDSVYGVTYPVAQYDHDGITSAISGGYAYEGTSIPALGGKYLFGDIPTGRLFYVNLSDLSQGKQAPIYSWNVSLNGVQKTLKELCGTDRVDLHFGRDQAGALYLLTKPDGKVYRIVSATTSHGER
ncbi:MAG: PQQ-dependent sugar dehydrogenase [Gemmatimonadaceae bacterium]